MWQAVRQSDVIHAVVPGDLGAMGILAGVAARKPMFIRHCGTWGNPRTISDHFLFWLLERIAGTKAVIFATGGGDHPPSTNRDHIRWIFSTSLRRSELDAMPPLHRWQANQPLRLVIVARQEPVKNTDKLIEALVFLRKDHDVRLEVVGDGSSLPDLR
jgi:hypothetical protein